jgi:hypothetical protein
LLVRTVEAGLVPAVNMDTGYAQLIDEATRRRVLESARDHAPNQFIAGAFVPDEPGCGFDADAHFAAAVAIAACGGTPVVMPSWGLHGLNEEAWVAAHEAIGARCERFIGFELSPRFAPNGRIVSDQAYASLLQVPTCIGAKHSALERGLEWQRLALRDKLRPDFRVLTGNDLAIDMVMYGSDYLLGLSTFTPEAFARRDRYWREQDARFFELNDRLQYLGAFAFREPVPAYKHNAAQFLHLTGHIAAPHAHPRAPTRPDTDVEVLREIASSLGELR